MGDAYAHANASAKCKLNIRVLQYSLDSFLSWANYHSLDQFLHEYLFHRHWRGSGRPPTKVQAKWRLGGSATPRGCSPQMNSDWAQFWWVSSCGLLDWAYEVWHDLEVVCFGFGIFTSCDWALIYLVSGPSPLRLMTGDVMPCLIVPFLMNFLCIPWISSCKWLKTKTCGNY